jgi:hypothetical protein
MAPSFSRVSSGALLLALAYNARPVNADFSEDVDNCKLVLDDLPADLTTDFCHDWTSGYAPEDASVTVTGPPVTITEYPDAKTCEGEGYSTTTEYPKSTPEPSEGYSAKYPDATSEPSEGYSAKYPEATSDSSKGYPALIPTNYYNASTTVPYGSTVVPYQTTKVRKRKLFFQSRRKLISFRLLTSIPRPMHLAPTMSLSQALCGLPTGCELLHPDQS